MYSTYIIHTLRSSGSDSTCSGLKVWVVGSRHWKLGAGFGMGGSSTGTTVVGIAVLAVLAGSHYAQKWLPNPKPKYGYQLAHAIVHH